jgi:hypothetical protein
MKNMRKNRKPFNCGMDKIQDLVAVILDRPFVENHGDSMIGYTSKFLREKLIRNK